MAYTTYLGSDGIFKIHRTGCTATDGCYVESVQHVYHETYDTMREAVSLPPLPIWEERGGRCRM